MGIPRARYSSGGYSCFDLLHNFLCLPETFTLVTMYWLTVESILSTIIGGLFISNWKSWDSLTQ